MNILLTLQITSVPNSKDIEFNTSWKPRINFLEEISIITEVIIMNMTIKEALKGYLS